MLKCLSLLGEQKREMWVKGINKTREYLLGVRMTIGHESEFN